MASPKTTNSKPEETETPLDESNETPAKQAEELASGEEQHGIVPLTEEFQLRAMEICKDLTKEECSFLGDLVSSRREELWKVGDNSNVTSDDYEAVKSQD